MMQKNNKILCGLRRTAYRSSYNVYLSAGEGEVGKSAAVPAPGLHPTPFEFLCDL